MEQLVAWDKQRKNRRKEARKNLLISVLITTLLATGLMTLDYFNLGWVPMAVVFGLMAAWGIAAIVVR